MDSYLTPVVIKIDCAKGLTAAIFLAFAEDGKAVITRITYNNLMLVALCYVNSQKWELNSTNRVMSILKMILPIKHSLCRPHVIRAMREQIVSSKNEKEVKDIASSLLILIKLCFSHATATISLTESIVNMALVLYLLESPTIYAEHDLIVDESGGVNIQQRLDAISDDIMDFVRTQIEFVREAVSDQYETVEKLGTIDPIKSDRYAVGDLVDAVIDAARRVELKMTVSYCTKISENYHYISTAFYFGSYPRRLDEKEKLTEEHYRMPRKPRCSVTPALSTHSEGKCSGCCFTCAQSIFLEVNVNILSH
jgi:hypothetical protein